MNTWIEIKIGLLKYATLIVAASCKAIRRKLCDLKTSACFMLNR